MTQIAFCMLLVPQGLLRSPCGNRVARTFRSSTFCLLDFLTESLVAPGVALVGRLHTYGSGQFSHFLLGDTLAPSRLTNASHLVCMNLESRHILQQPA